MKTYFYSEEKGITAALGAEDKMFFGSAICLGDFDGVHKGHQALFSEAAKYGNWGVLLFDRNIKGREMLTTLEEKISFIEAYGADFSIIAEFSEKFSKKTPEEFVSFLENTLKVTQIICGYDYRFGYKASGSSEMLKDLSENAEVTVLDAVKIGNTPIKSTLIRDLVKNGDIKKANEVSGHPYVITGIVEKGFGNGRKMGLPTANIGYCENKLLPSDGVYYGKVKGHDAVINVGKNPTFDAVKRTVEVHIPNYEKDMYGDKIAVEFLEKIRDDIKFDNVEKLIERINKDIEFVKGKKDYGKENFN